ncbi:MAG: UDP-glucose--hexose-1-phosphate uridylyltransferase, partial [Phaeodactylibacter sp.]|nr:UDP-glucose--hexose-1-phosphate uridylyltransferase [Phaeodactylibacter sp.]MCB9265401.1 UDP-glucose--hexose-1-phosphate uridylyltransferase [Lewinellaceae bacterium]MCB9289832.1 UDP-glucose--hexose-1-phosphate uridylyltransferase [Lewinellaceae bacterium]
MLNFSEDPHLRYNILTGEWVLASPHRTKRPWQGKVEKAAAPSRPSYDPQCYLCPGNTRAGGHKNPAYKDTFVFTNDFAALKPDSSDSLFENGLLQARGERGICKVLCFSPDHSLTLPDMSVEAIEKVVGLWQKEYRELGALDFIQHVQIFENKGEIMGCSNPHPHGQIWAQASVPQEVAKKSAQQLNYWKANGSSLLKDYLTQETDAKERLICRNDHFVALVPFWAVWPYEAMIIPVRHFQHIGQMHVEEKKAFAAILKALTQRFDRLFDTSFPYSAGIHQSPTDGASHPEWHFHMSFYPPLLRSATVKKFMVGYEMFANPQRDITAEMAAEQLRALGACRRST